MWIEPTASRYAFLEEGRAAYCPASMPLRTWIVKTHGKISNRGRNHLADDDAHNKISSR